MTRTSCWSAAVGFFGALAVLLMVSIDRDSRLPSLDLSSSQHKYGGGEKTQTAARVHDDQIGSVVFSGKTKHDNNKTEEAYQPPEPSVTWLMSFPNSGTSYTMANTQSISGSSTATNYALEIPQEYGDPVPIRLTELHSDHVQKGPWKLNPGLSLPPKRVLCKTHCTGYDDKESVGESVRTFETFLDGCRETHQKKDKTKSSSKRNKRHALYEVEGLVDSAIHLIRDPFDNVISRMHLGFRNKHIKEFTHLSQEQLEAFMKSKKGVKAWCESIDNIFWNKTHTGTKKDVEISNETLSLLPYDPFPYLHVPCHGEFFRYTQWHNYAVELIKKRNLAVLTVHYENYGTTYNRTVDQILDFLGQSREFDPMPFKSGKTYRDSFFDNSVQHEVKHLIKEIASEETWALLRRYFTSSHDDDDDEVDNRD